MENNAQNASRIDSLQELLQKNYDAEAGYKQVMTKAKNPALKGWLQEKAAQRSNFATAINAELRSLNVEPKESGTILGDLHRGWIDIKTAVASDSDEAVLEECIRGERASVKEYENHVQTLSGHQSSHGLVNEQLASIKSALQTVKKLEDLQD